MKHKYDLIIKFVELFVLNKCLVESCRIYKNSAHRGLIT